MGSPIFRVIRRILSSLVEELNSSPVSGQMTFNVLKLSHFTRVCKSTPQIRPIRAPILRFSGNRGGNYQKRDINSSEYNHFYLWKHETLFGRIWTAKREMDRISGRPWIFLRLDMPPGPSGKVWLLCRYMDKSGVSPTRARIGLRLTNLRKYHVLFVKVRVIFHA